MTWDYNACISFSNNIVSSRTKEGEREPQAQSTKQDKRVGSHETSLSIAAS